MEAMLGWRPSVLYKYLWKYVCLLAMLGLLGATTVRMLMETPTYMSWNQEMVRSGSEPPSEGPLEDNQENKSL